MTEQPFEDQSFQFDRSELFALGAATGAVLTAVLSSYLERRRRPQTPWERAQVQGAEALHALSSTTQAGAQQAKQAAARVSERFQDKETTRSRWWKQARRRSRRRSKQAKRSLDLTGTIATVLGAATAGSALEKAREYATGTSGRVTGGTLRDIAHSAQDYSGKLAHQAQESIRDVHLGKRARHYGTALTGYTTGATLATRQAAQQGVTKLSKGASLVAEATSEQAQGLRKGVRKTTKRTRRRVGWGLRAFIIGLVVGVLAAPQSGRRTRDIITSFVQDMLDVFMPTEQPSTRI